MESDGRAGLERLVASGFAYDLVVADIEMPYMSGVQMIREARRLAPKKLNVLFNSGITDPSLIQDIEADGLGAYLVKFSEAALLEAAGRTLAAEPCLRSSFLSSISHVSDVPETVKLALQTKLAADAVQEYVAASPFSARKPRRFSDDS